MFCIKKKLSFVNLWWPNLRYIAVTWPWRVKTMRILPIRACAQINHGEYIAACIFFIITIIIIVIVLVVTSVSSILKWLICNQFHVVYLLLKLYIVVTERIHLPIIYEYADPVKNTTINLEDMILLHASCHSWHILFSLSHRNVKPSHVFYNHITNNSVFMSSQWSTQEQDFPIAVRDWILFRHLSIDPMKTCLCNGYFVGR